MSAPASVLCLAPEATTGGAVDRATRVLRAAGVEGPRRDARLIVAEALGWGVAATLAHADAPLTPEAAARIDALVARRAARAPMAQVLGRRAFRDLTFRVTADVLDPRPESESVVEAGLAVLARRKGAPIVLDLGVGSGCLLLSLLHEHAPARGFGVDRSAAALAVARDNARRLGLAARAGFLVGDWASAIAGAFDLIVANPPYIASRALAALAPEVRAHEPRAALDGGPDGLKAYRAILPQLGRLLAPGGAFVTEVGAGQAGEVAALGEPHGLVEIARHTDLAGHARALVLARSTRGLRGAPKTAPDAPTEKTL